MKRYIDELTKRIDELIKTYEQHLWKNPSDSLFVMLKDNKIMFNLLHDSEIIDEVYLTFEEKERNFYMAVCLKTFVLLLGNVMVYRDMVDGDTKMYFNEKQKPYFVLVSDDNEMTSLLDSIVNNQEEVVIKNNKIIMDASSKVKKYLPNTMALYNLDRRIEASKELLRSMK